MPELPVIEGHPLAEADEGKCYDVMLAERSYLVSTKQLTENELIRNIIKTSSGALLIVPGLGASHAFPMLSKTCLIIVCVGLSLFVLAMLSGLIEQLLSSNAYDKQIDVTINFYAKRSVETYDKKSSRNVKRAQYATFVLFFLAIGLTSAGFIWEVTETTMAQKPAPPPRPSPPSRPIPDHKGDVPGRSVPPSAPPPPPPSKK